MFYVLQQMNSDTNSCTNTELFTTHRHSDTNLPYSSLVTLQFRGKFNKQGFEKRKNMKGNSNSVEYIKIKCEEKMFG